MVGGIGMGLGLFFYRGSLRLVREEIRFRDMLEVRFFRIMGGG